MKAKMTIYQKGGKMPIVPDPKKKMGMQPNKSYATNKKYFTEADFKNEPAGSTTRDEWEDASNKGKLYKYSNSAGEMWGRNTLAVPPLQKKGLKVVAEPVKKVAGGGKMPMYGMGGKLKKYMKGGKMKDC